MKLFRSSALLLVLTCAALAQNRVSFAGLKNAANFAYGIAPGAPQLTVDNASPTSASSVGTITLQFGQVVLADGTKLTPITTTTPITIGSTSAGTLETVTPSAVSCTTPLIYDSCTFTATFTYSHGKGEPVSSGTFGIAEAVNAAHAAGGGLVAFDAQWVQYGGAISQFSGKTYGWANVTLLDWRGTTTAKSYAATNGAAYAVTAISLY